MGLLANKGEKYKIYFINKFLYFTTKNVINNINLYINLVCRICYAT